MILMIIMMMLCHRPHRIWDQVYNFPSLGHIRSISSLVVTEDNIGGGDDFDDHHDDVIPQAAQDMGSGII